MPLLSHLWWKRVISMSEEIFKKEKNFSLHVENKQLKEENEQLRKEN